MVFKDLFDYINKRSYSTLIVVFIAFWIICHSQGFATMLFTDQNFIYEKYGLLKNEYLNQYFFGCNLNFKTDFWGAADFLIRSILPFILTWLYVWYAPKWIINKAYEKQIHYKVERDLIKEVEQRRLIRDQKETIKAEISATKEQTKLVEESKKLENKDPRIAWKKDYLAFIQLDGARQSLARLSDAIYEHYGYFGSSMSVNDTLLCDTHGLIIVEERKCSLTDKGKFFLKCLAEEK